MGWPLDWEALEPLPQEAFDAWLSGMRDGSWWVYEPDVPRLATGIPQRVNRLKALGNGQVPVVVAAAWNLLK